MSRISHLTTVHYRYDTRVFHKMCSSLSENGYDTSLIVADGKGNETTNGVKIYDVGKFNRRIVRMVRATDRLFRKALDLDADLYHLHDPELLFTGLRLKRLGKTVIFDSHEDVPKQIRNKTYLNSFSRRILSFAFAHIEHYACSRLDAIIAATPCIRDRFINNNEYTVDINNFPIFGELTNPHFDGEVRSTVCYIRDIGTFRGIREIVKAMEFVHPGIRLQIAGRFSDGSIRDEVTQYAGWEKVDELGFVDRKGLREVLSRSMAGLVTLHPISNFIEARPVKMFEYMSAGVPVIASDFPLWREIIYGNECGICVNPLDPQTIADAINTIADNREHGRQMGSNGQLAVKKHYSWALEYQKLVELYETVLKRRSISPLYF